MVCHLNDLIESIDQNKILCVEPINDDEFDEITRVTRKAASEAICFDMGEVDGMPNIAPVYEMVKEPFPTCWFEFNFIHTDGTQIILGMLVVVRDEVQITTFRRKHKQWCLRGAIILDSLSTWENFKLFPPVNVICDELKQHKIVLSVFLTALNCKNVKRVEHKPSQKLQKARMKKGKLPLFSHWTLELTIPGESNNSSKSGGAKSSPRVHLRRGHPRQYKPGMWTWVQPCMVGTGHGIVTKDYVAKFESPEE